MNQKDEQIAQLEEKLHTLELENANLTTKYSLVTKAAIIGSWDMIINQNAPESLENHEYIWSDEFRQILGFSNEEDFPNTLDSWASRIHPDDDNKRLEALNKHLFDKTGQTPYWVEYRLLRKNGEYGVFEVFGTSQRDNEGNALRMVGALKDITDRRKAVEAIEFSRQILHTVLNNINTNIFVFDIKTSKILFANTCAKKTYGEKIEGKICWQVLQDGMTDLCPFCPRAKLLDSNRRSTGLCNWEYFSSYNKQWYECYDVAIKWVNGQFAHLQYAININERKIGEQALIKAKEKAEEADRLKSSFLANMSHEIRTPLNAIMGFSNLLATKNYTEERRKGFLEDIQNNSRQLLTVISDVLDISKIESGQLELSYIWVSLNQLMQSVYDTLQFQAKEKGINLFCQKSLPDSQTQIYVDDVRLKQVLLNLVSNAIKFTIQGFVHFGYTLRDDKMLEFFVKDTGVGIATDQQTNIFNPFRQENEGTARRFGGTGLGLSISKHLVELMKGSIGVESEKDKGSHFFFTVPYVHSDENQVIQADKIRTFDVENIDSIVSLFNGEKILVVDDYEPSFVLISEILSAFDVTVHYESCGQDGISFVENNPDVALIFMDIHMPEMNGVETMKAIKAKHPHIPIVAQTAFALKEDQKKFLAEGFNHYASKPLRNDDLMRVLKNVFKKKTGKI